MGEARHFKIDMMIDSMEY